MWLANAVAVLPSARVVFPLITVFWLLVAVLAFGGLIR
jgi:hypothetical protein